MKNFDSFGIMLDCSRNAVMTVPTLKKFISVISKMGYNQLQLYTEDTYEVDGEAYFGYFRGRYTQEELREADEFAFANGVELVPCIQTLAHMNAAVRWPKYADMVDFGDILLVGDERTYTLIDSMFSSLRKCFRTNKIHIGMDEAHMLGKGRYKDIHGEQPGSDILLSHLTKVCEIADKYGFEPMMWSDMFYRIACGEYYSKTAKFNPEIKAKIPEKLTLVYWDYYHTKQSMYESLISGHKQICDRVVFAGGAWKWCGFAPYNDFSMRVMKPSINACIKGGIRNMFITMWGDDGAEASPFALLPSLCYASCLARGITDKDEIKAFFKDCIGYSFDDFMLLDLPNKATPSYWVINPSKYMLYNDCFMGIMDTAAKPTDSKKYASFARRLANASKRTGEYSYLFDAASKLCAALALKATIGTVTREVYDNKDKKALKSLITDYTKMIKRTEAFYYSFRKQWYIENKPHGFDVQDIRLGGLTCRMKSCKDRLVSLQGGEIASIPELEEKPLPFITEPTCYNSWRLSVTANVL